MPDSACFKPYSTRSSLNFDRFIASAKRDHVTVFLAGANSHWPVDTLRGLLTAHGAHHVQQIQQLRDKQYSAEDKTWASMTKHMYVIADALAGGLAAQFPEKFR